MPKKKKQSEPESSQTEQSSVSLATVKSIPLTADEHERSRKDAARQRKAELKSLEADTKTFVKNFKRLEEDTNNQLFVLRESFKSFAYENRSVLESIRYFFAHRKQNESLMGYTDGEKWAKECLDVTYRYVCGLLNPPKNTLLLTDGTKVSSPDRIETVHDEPAVEDIEDAEFEDVPAENSAAVESDPATIAVPGAPVYEEKIAYPRYADGKSTSLIDEVTHSDYDYETQIKILRIVIGNLQAAIPEIEAEIKAAA